MNTTGRKTRASLAELKKVKGRSDLSRLLAEQKREQDKPDTKSG